MSQIFTRRGFVTAAPAAVVAATVPALSAAGHPDAALLALREPYERTLATMDAAGQAHTLAENRYFALRTAYPDRDERQLRKDSDLIVAQRRYHRTIRRNDDVVRRVAATHAPTLAGVAFKARVSRREDNLMPELMERIVDDLIAMGGAHA